MSWLMSISIRGTHWRETKAELSRISDLCHWTSGTWSELSLPWNELQNTPRHISALSNYIARAYVEARVSQR